MLYILLYIYYVYIYIHNIYADENNFEKIREKKNYNFFKPRNFFKSRCVSSNYATHKRFLISESIIQ